MGREIRKVPIGWEHPKETKFRNGQMKILSRFTTAVICNLQTNGFRSFYFGVKANILTNCATAPTKTRSRNFTGIGMARRPTKITIDPNGQGKKRTAFVFMKQFRKAPPLALFFHRLTNWQNTLQSTAIFGIKNAAMAVGELRRLNRFASPVGHHLS